MTPFFERITERAKTLETLVCIGLDPSLDKLPEKAKFQPEPISYFCKEIIKATHDLVLTYKINLAFFEALGWRGWEILRQVKESIPPEVPIIADAKRSDIGNTSAAYAKGIFNEMGFDAVTLNPYMGRDSLEPFMNYKEKGCFILCLTSNPGAADFELPNDLYLKVARKSVEWNTHNNLGLVVGATLPSQMKTIREIARDLWFLVPGIGTQGGDLTKTIQNGRRPNSPPFEEGLIINSSRGILYASSDSVLPDMEKKKEIATLNEVREKNLAPLSKGGRGDKDFAIAARNATLELKNQINTELKGL